MLLSSTVKPSSMRLASAVRGWIVIVRVPSSHVSGAGVGMEAPAEDVAAVDPTAGTLLSPAGVCPQPATSIPANKRNNAARSVRCIGRCIFPSIANTGTGCTRCKTRPARLPYPPAYQTTKTRQVHYTRVVSSAFAAMLFAQAKAIWYNARTWVCN